MISVTDSTHFTYTVTGTPATPATGTITIKCGRTTVPGIVYLDSYFFVMDTNAVIYNSALNDPTTWDALDIITAEKEPGAGVALAKSQSYVIALKEWSTEFSTITRTLQALRLNQCSAPLRWSAARPENRSQRLTKRSIG